MLEEYFSTFDTIMRELENAVSKVEETDKVCHLLLYWNGEYDPVITAIETLNTDVTMDFVKSRLLDEEIKTKSSQKCTNREEVSFNTFPFNCYRCDKPEHKISDCTQQKQFTRENRRGRSSRFHSCGRGSAATLDIELQLIDILKRP
ncbi:hypothetical protein JTB14_007653 [Gonioctena quinquepunctata]|nr:hypothetical protein JTB14_007653 [Gonioctena quinquepunctata]